MRRREPIAATARARTFEDVNRPGGNHIDRRRSLLPRDYLQPPHQFGRDGAVWLVTPPGGDSVSRDVAWVQHLLVRAWRQDGGAFPVGVLARKFGMSKQVMSRVTLGQRWMGETVAAALVYAAQARTLPAEARNPASPSSARGAAPGE